MYHHPVIFLDEQNHSDKLCTIFFLKTFHFHIFSNNILLTAHPYVNSKSHEWHHYSLDDNTNYLQILLYINESCSIHKKNDWSMIFHILDNINTKDVHIQFGILVQFPNNKSQITNHIESYNDLFFIFSLLFSPLHFC